MENAARGRGGRKLAAILGLAGMAAAGCADGVQAACPVESAYDITVGADALVFDSANGAQRRIEMRNGALLDRGKPIPLSAQDRSRIQRFERTARGLVPPVKSLGARAVDLMRVAVREEAQQSSPRSASNPQLNARLDARAAELKTRIAGSTTSRDWRGQEFRRYMAGALGDVIPLIGGDLAQQALEATLRGEFGRARVLGERAAGLKSSLEQRVRIKLDGMRPEVEKLCPALRALDSLEAGVTAPLTDGSRLDLLQVGGR